MSESPRMYATFQQAKRDAEIIRSAGYPNAKPRKGTHYDSNGHAWARYYVTVGHMYLMESGRVA